MGAVWYSIRLKVYPDKDSSEESEKLTGILAYASATYFVSLHFLLRDMAMSLSY
jgi:hypothetical protein